MGLSWTEEMGIGSKEGADGKLTSKGSVTTHMKG